MFYILEHKQKIVKHITHVVPHSKPGICITVQTDGIKLKCDWFFLPNLLVGTKVIQIIANLNDRRVLQSTVPSILVFWFSIGLLTHFIVQYVAPNVWKLKDMFIYLRAEILKETTFVPQSPKEL